MGCRLRNSLLLALLVAVSAVAPAFSAQDIAAPITTHAALSATPSAIGTTTVLARTAPRANPSSRAFPCDLLAPAAASFAPDHQWSRLDGNQLGHALRLSAVHAFGPRAPP